MSFIPALSNGCFGGSESVSVDVHHAQKFLDCLEDDPGLFSFQVFDDKKRGTTIPQILHGSFETHRDTLIRLNTQGTAGIFVTVNQTDLKGRKADNVTAIRAYFVDLDDPEQAPLQAVLEGPLEPHLVVQSSEKGKYHAYWLIDEAPLGNFREVQAVLLSRFHGDPKIKDVNRVMRLPGFLHHKGDPVRSTIISDSGARPYFYEEFLQAFQIDLKERRGAAPRLGTDHDPLLHVIQDQGLYNETIRGRRGGHKILCPWRDEHTTGETGTAYFEAYTNGYSCAAFVCQHAHCADRDIDDLRHFLGVKNQPRRKKEAGDESPAHHRPQIYVRGGEITRILDEAEQALLNDKTNLYQRDGVLVRMVQKRYLSLSGVKRPDGLMAINPLEVPFLVEVFTREAEWYSSDRRLKGDHKWKRCDCPERLAKIFLARGVWKLPVLQGVITAPTLRADGSVLDQKGYDKVTGLFFHSTLDFPVLSPNPTIDDAVSAVDTLKQLLKGFPFVDKASLSVAMSAIITALVRRSLVTAPLHAFNAPKRGSGKSLLADVVGLIATGLKPTQMSQPENRAEERKRFLALLMAGDPVICIDNVERPLGSDALCTILTSDTWSERLLGENKNIDVSTNVLFLATGNNIVFEGDLTRRVLKSTIDPRCERPEERPFKVNLHHYVQDNRASLVHAGLTILRAYDSAGRPSQGLSPLGSFEDWSNWVRSAIVWSGLEDPCLTRQSVEAEDPVSGSLRRLLMAWYAEFKEPVLARTVLDRAGENHSELRDVIEEFVGDPMKIGTRRFGARLQKYQNRTEGGLRIVQRGTTQRAVLWMVESVSEKRDCS